MHDNSMANNDKKVHSGHRSRMKNRLKKNGSQTFEDHELLEMLLYYCVPQKDTNELAHRLLSGFGSLGNLFQADSKEVVKRFGVTENMAMLFTISNGIFKRINSQKFDDEHRITSSNDAGELAVAILTGESEECFYVVCLDGKNRVIATECISRGVVNGTFISLRMIAEKVLTYKSRSVIFMHNHPNGLLKPSFEDINTTQRLIKMLNLIEIYVLDHIIVAEGNYFSMADNGLLKNDL